MTLADLEKFVTGPAVYKGSNGVVQAPFTASSLGQKRKTEEMVSAVDDSHNISLHLYHLTLSKLLSSPQRRVEPPLQRSVVMRNTLKQLEFGIFSHSPSKRIYLDLDESTALNNLHLSPQPPSVITSPPPNVDGKPATKPADSADTTHIPSNQDLSSARTTTEAAFNFCDLLPVVSTSDSVSAAVDTANQQTSSHSQSPDAMDVTPSFFAAAQPCSTESLEKLKYAPLSDVEFQSLINSSMDQYSLRDAPQTNRPANQNHDELDSIMQVLVSM